MAMRRLLLTTAILLAGCSADLAQVSTIGSTAMGLPSTPGGIVSSPLTGPSPFSATTQPGTADMTLAPVPLASDPTTPGTSVNCSPVSAQTTQTNSSAPVTASPTPSSPSTFAAPPGTIVPQGTIEPPGTIVVAPGTNVAQGTTVASTSTPAPMPLGPSATTFTSISGSTTGTISPVSLLGGASSTVCSSIPGGP